MVRQALGKAAVRAEGIGDGVPLVVQILFCRLFEGLSVPGRLPGVAGERGLHAEQVMSFHGQEEVPCASPE